MAWCRQETNNQQLVKLLRSVATRRIVQKFVEAKAKNNIKSLHYWYFVRGIFQ